MSKTVTTMLREQIREQQATIKSLITLSLDYLERIRYAEAQNRAYIKRIGELELRIEELEKEGEHD